MRGSELHQITTDDTMAEKLVESGALEPEDVAESRLSSVLSQAIGGAEKGIRPSVQVATLGVGDTVLLCTDGLTDHVADFEIAEVLSTNEPAESKCRKLIKKANDAGGSDNITVVVCRVLESEG